MDDQVMFCKFGHAQTVENVELSKDGGRVRRRCKPCRKLGYKSNYKPRTHCLRGHELTNSNVYAYVSKQGHKIRECKTCITSKNTRRAQKLRDSHLMRNYGITQADFDVRLAAQGGGCKVCQTTVPGGMGSFHIDHDHSCCPGKKCCGKCIRGLLCRRCNDMLGKVVDSVEILQSMVSYLQSSEFTWTPVSAISGKN